MDKRPIFGLEPDQLDEILSVVTDGFDKSELRKAESPSSDRPKQPEISKLAETTASLQEPIEKLGSRIGPYKLLSILGEGGMGIVYLAEQKRPIKRRVALKVIKPGMDSKAVIARFEAERQALALLEHPNIAHVLDADTTETGRPYFVMEYVKGIPITEHCDHHKLTIENRLKLFLQICHAVNHAHQKGIIHRDLKPSNILVSTTDDQAVPKIIDFGVAKAINQSLTEKTLFTEQGQLFGTPEYMSPEQADMLNEDIDTRSDIYSLGVLLYVLLTGVLPFDSTKLREGGIEHIRQVIRQTNPKTPSTRLSNLGEEAKKAAGNRSTELTTLTKCLHKELEWIPLKAMRKERSERYRSAPELADDVENYLHSAPLIAGPPKTLYKLKKFIRRNQTLVTGVAAVLVVLVAGIIVSMIFAIGQARARVEAQVVSDFLRNSVLASLDTYTTGGKAITIHSVLDAASERLEERFMKQPLAEADIRGTLGLAYWSLGEYEHSESNYRRSFELYRVHYGPNHPQTLQRMKNLGWVYYYQSRYDEAEQQFADALQRMQLVLDEEHWNRVHTMASLGCTYYMKGHFNEAEKLCLNAYEIKLRTLGEEQSHLVNFISMLGFCYILQGRYEEAEQLHNKGLEICHRELSDQHWDKLMLMNNLGILYKDMGRYEEAEKLLLKVLDNRSQAWGQTHPDTLSTMNTLAWLYYSQGRYEQAKSMFVKTMETSLPVLGDAHLTNLSTMHGLGTVYLNQGQYDEAESLLEKALKIAGHKLGEENWATLRIMNTLANLYKAQDHYKKAEKIFHQALETRITMLGEDHPDTLETKNDLAMLYKEQDDFEKAEKLFIEAFEGRLLKLGDTHPHTIESKNNLIELYEAWNKPEKAEYFNNLYCRWAH